MALNADKAGNAPWRPFSRDLKLPMNIRTMLEETKQARDGRQAGNGLTGWEYGRGSIGGGEKDGGSARVEGERRSLTPQEVCTLVPGEVRVRVRSDQRRSGVKCSVGKSQDSAAAKPGPEC